MSEAFQGVRIGVGRFFIWGPNNGSKVTAAGALVVDGQHLRHQPCGIETVGHRKSADPRNDKPQGVDRFTALECGDADRGRAEEGDQKPEEEAHGEMVISHWPLVNG